MTSSKRLPIVLAALTAIAIALGLAWWGWQVSDPGMLLFGTRLC